MVTSFLPVKNEVAATQIVFYVHPYLGKIPNLTNIFQMGWFNHQPEKGEGFFSFSRLAAIFATKVQHVSLQSSPISTAHAARISVSHHLHIT